MEELAGLGFFGSLLGNLFGANATLQATRETNRTNREIFQQQSHDTEVQNQLTREFNSAEAEKNRAFNAAEAEKAFNREAEYNSYTAQMERMRAAGINPNSINQQLSSSANATAASGSAASASALGPPSAPVQHVPDVGQYIRSIVNDTFNNNLLRKQADKVGAETRRVDELLPLEKDQIQKAIDLAISQAGLNNEQADQVKQLTPVLVGKNQEEIKQIAAVIEQLKADKKLKLEQLKGEKLENLSRKVTKEIAEKYGIVIDGNGMTTLITTLLTPHGSEIVSQILQNLGRGLVHGVRDGIFSLFPSLNR